jgi:CrcB protein
MDWRGIGLVALGGALGTLARFGVSTAIPTKGFPWATLAINLVGSFALGFLLLRGGMEHATRLAVAVGFLGAFTTLSTYSAETVALWRYGHVGAAVANVLANGVGGPLAALLGWKLSA